jgi:hypothetical protein
MNLNELQRSLRQLRLGGMAAVLETRLQQAQAEPMAPLDLLATLVSDELTRRSDYGPLRSARGPSTRNNPDLHAAQLQRADLCANAHACHWYVRLRR